MALVALFTLPPLIHRLLVQHCSCVCSTMGIRSLGLTSLLLPAKATQIPGVHPLSHSSFRTSSVSPRKLRTPLVRNLNCFAIPLQTNSGFVIHSGDILFVHGAPRLHSFLFFSRGACVWYQTCFLFRLWVYDPTMYMVLTSGHEILKCTVESCLKVRGVCRQVRLNGVILPCVFVQKTRQSTQLYVSPLSRFRAF